MPWNTGNSSLKTHLHGKFCYILWKKIGRLSQGIPGRVQGTNTIFFIPKSAGVPPKCTITYARIVPSIHPQKEETHGTRITIGGNLLTYESNTAGTPSSKLTTTKQLFLKNSIISTPNSRFTNMDIKDFYLDNMMKLFEYMNPYLTTPRQLHSTLKLTWFSAQTRICVCWNLQKRVWWIKTSWTNCIQCFSCPSCTIWILTYKKNLSSMDVCHPRHTNHWWFWSQIHG